MPPQQPDIQLPETDALRRDGLATIDRAKQIMIASHDDYTFAGAELVRIAGIRKSITAAFREPKEKSYQAHKAITKLENDLLAYPVEAERIIKGGMARFQSEDARRRREEEARIRADLKRREEDAILQEAQALSDAGETAAAERLLETPVLAPVVELAKPQAQGVIARRKWGFRITDATRINPDFKIVDEKKIRATVIALGPDARSLIGEGVEIFEDTVMAVRT